MADSSKGVQVIFELAGYSRSGDAAKYVPLDKDGIPSSSYKVAGFGTLYVNKNQFPNQPKHLEVLIRERPSN